VSRGNSSSTWRPVAVWSVVTTTASAAAASVPGQWPATEVDDLVVAVCTTGLALALGWLWVITTVTVVGLLTGRLRAGGGATRRLVLVACGAAVLAGTGVPALASGGDGNDLLVGLTLPDRAVAPQRVHRTPEASHPAAPETYVVRPGDSLWSIARAHPDDSGSVDQRWRAIWRANRDVVGDDPDLIIPDQALRLPTHQPPHRTPHHPTQHPYSDGDR
jgi:LysM repeat protein